MRRVLVLNQDYSPLSVTSAERAFVLMHLDKAEMVHQHAEMSFRTVSTSYPMPSVIRLQKFVYIPFKSVMLTRQNIFKRDYFECQYCGNQKDLTLDHVVPKSRGGGSVWKNLVTACKPCNSRKGNHTPEEADMNLKTNPFKPSFIVFIKNFSGFTAEEWHQYLGVN